MKTGIIYMTTNIISGKSYIGLTIQKLNGRIKDHYKDAYKKNHHYKFANALRKYNKEDWEWNILYKDIPQNQLPLAELCAIYLYDTYHFGYNSTEGGEVNPMSNPESVKKMILSRAGQKRPDNVARNKLGKGKKLSEEHRQKLSQNSSRHFLGKKHTDESKDKMSAAKQDYVPWNKGKPHSEETKQKLKEAWKKRKLSDGTFK